MSDLTPAELAAALARLPRRTTERVCAHCGATFAAVRRDARFCNTNCEQQARRKRQKW